MSSSAFIPYITSWVIFIPLIGMLALLFIKSEEVIKTISLVTTVIALMASMALYQGYDASLSGAQLVDLGAQWMGDIDIKYFVGIDGLNILLILLTTILGPIVVLCSWTYIKKNVKGYFALLLLLQTGVTGVFASFDVILFYIFFELTLIPMYFIIGIWGGENRVYAAIKFVLYTLVGSILMLAGIIYLGYVAGDVVNGGVFTADWYKLIKVGLPMGTQTWLFGVFALAFCIKVPLFPLHTWLPDAHVQAPTGGSVVLAGVLLKMGTYGLVRYCLPFFPNAAQEYAMIFAVLAVIGIVYGALVAAVQKDAKKLVAYSSVSHLGFVVLGIFAFDLIGLQGAMIQMINHGLSTGALFIIVGMLYERRHTRLMSDFGGIARSVPILTFFMVFSVLASVGLPGLNGFVGEFMILVGSFKSSVIGSPILIAIATTGVIFAAFYLLWMIHKIFWGPLDKEENRIMKDLDQREIALLIPLVILMLWLGLAPGRFLNDSEVASRDLLENIEIKRTAIESPNFDSPAEIPNIKAFYETGATE